ncbi:hypothetical protein HOD30_04860 [Candidatus Peregrinibacteria bacterium]|jgi:hypothetical protein|nr:hypothetical protein [Candidatus Peregrinibacteria bacterium]MBT4631733.1 hypothetical protein [Candidatus Peregrinibacteria bacterium]
MATTQNQTPIYKRWYFIALICAIVFVALLPNCTSNLEEAAYDHPMVLDIASLINTSPENFESVLGEGKHDFFESAGDISWNTDTYYIDAHFENNQSSELFFNYIKAGASEEEVLAAGNLENKASNYRIEIQPWLDPSSAGANGEAQIAGVHVYAK